MVNVIGKLPPEWEKKFLFSLKFLKRCGLNCFNPFSTYINVSRKAHTLYIFYFLVKTLRREKEELENRNQRYREKVS